MYDCQSGKTPLRYPHPHLKRTCFFFQFSEEVQFHWTQKYLNKDVISIKFQGVDDFLTVVKSGCRDHFPLRWLMVGSVVNEYCNIVFPRRLATDVQTVKLFTSPNIYILIVRECFGIIRSQFNTLLLIKLSRHRTWLSFDIEKFPGNISRRCCQ